MYELSPKYKQTLQIIYDTTPELKPVIEKLFENMPSNDLVIISQEEKNRNFAAISGINVKYTISEVQLDELNEYIKITAFDMNKLKGMELTLHTLPLRDPAKPEQCLWHAGRSYAAPIYKGSSRRPLENYCVMAKYSNNSGRKKENKYNVYAVNNNVKNPTLYVFNDINQKQYTTHDMNRMFEIEKGYECC